MIKIALIGCGYWGGRVLNAILKAPWLELVSVYDKDSSRLEQLRRTYGDFFTYADSYQEILKDTSIDAVALTVSTVAHFEMAEKALAAGKHIFIEKPFTETLAQAEILYELAKEKERIIHVDHIMIYHTAIRKMKELLKDGYLGDVRYMEMRRTSFGGSRADVSVLQDLAVHDISIIDYLTDGAEPVKACSISEKLGFSQASIAFMLLKYPGFSAELTASWVSPDKERRIVLGGTDKTLIFDEIVAPNKLMIYDNNDPHDLCIVETEEADALEKSLTQFCESAELGTKSLTDGASAVRVMKILTRLKERD